MKTFQISSTEQLREIFPELEEKSKFRKTIDAFFAQGHIFQLGTTDPFRCFVSKSGQEYKLKMIANGLYVNFQTTKLSPDSATREQLEANPVKYKDVSEDFYISQGSVNNVPFRHECYRCTSERIQPISWALIGLQIGKIFEKTLVDLESCDKCMGRGVIPAFYHIHNGVCFKCLGIGKWFVLPKKVKSQKLSVNIQN